MAEYWKSTPRYWCKYCSTYVRDTKLERQNHDATAKHQSAIKRSLRDLHRGQEREERDKERAKREIDRLNGVVTSSSGAGAGFSSSSGPSTNRDGSAKGESLGESERKRQVEQLASLGVSIPDQFRGDLAMAGEWTVTSTAVVLEKKHKDQGNPEANAKGVHKRERTEEEVETEEAVKGLFKKPRRWGRDSKTGGEGASEELDALLGGGLVVKKKDKEEEEQDQDQDQERPVKKEAAQEEGSQKVVKTEEVKAETPLIKKEPSDHDDNDDAPAQMPDRADDYGDGDKASVVPPRVKTEGDTADGESTASAVVFKKRKPKHVRQK